MSFEFPDGRELFSKISLSLNAGLTALVGPNGAGKSTLAQLLAGELEPSRGLIQRHRRVVLFRQREKPPEICAGEYLEWSQSPLLSNLIPSTLCSQLSGGEWMRLRLAASLTDDYLILDEPTNDLDRSAREIVLAALRERESGTLLISHDREALSLVDDVLELSNRGLTKYGGGWAAYEDTKLSERNEAQRQLEKAQRARKSANAERSSLREAQEKRNRRGQKAADRGGTPKILLGARKRRAQATTGQVDVRSSAQVDETLEKARAAYDQLKIEPSMYAHLLGAPTQKLIAEARGFNVRVGDRWLYERDLDFAWKGSARVSISGPNGSGKSTLLRVLTGQVRCESRGLLRVGQIRSLYLDQQLSQLQEEATVLENVQDALSLTETRNQLASFLFTGERVFQKVSTLSGGERLRVALAKGFLSGRGAPELLILDEPTNNLDLSNVTFLERLVAQFPGAVITVSHDRAFLDACELNEDYDITGN